MLALLFVVINCIILIQANEYIRFHPKDTSSPPEKPKWPERVYAEGYLSLPYAELSEPFTSWYDAKTKRSRIDYYGGMSKTIQRGDQGDNGIHYMIAPMTNEVVRNKISCFALNGTSDAPVGPQQILPDITNFTYIGEKQYNSIQVNVWEYRFNNGAKYNTYTLYTTQTDGNAVFYEMLGYDSLLGSHFDEYKIIYTLMKDDFDDGVFDEMAGMTCTGFPGPGHEARVVANPMKEFVYPEDQSHLSPMYDDFVDNYDKKSTNRKPAAFTSKQHTFKHNIRYINSMNRKNLSFKLKVNHLADHSPNELRRLRGRRTTVGMNGKNNNGKAFVKSVSMKDVPAEKNWRLYGAVTPVKDQAVCGSCWSFGSTGTVEGSLFLKTGRLVRLSQQHLMDCSWGFGNNACDGGEEFRSYEYMMKHGGVATEQSYGQYLGADSFCHPETATITAKISGYVNVTSGDLDALKMAIAQQGPVAVGIDAAHLSFVFYSHGVYYEEKCGNTPDDLDHAVLAVGYGTQDGQPYWLVKNSWSTHWGNDGYVLMSQKNNNCGVATDATYVILADD